MVETYGIFSFGSPTKYLAKLIDDFNRGQSQFVLRYLGEKEFPELEKDSEGARYCKTEESLFAIAEGVRNQNQGIDYIIGIFPFIITNEEYFNTEPEDDRLIGILSIFDLEDYALKSGRKLAQVLSLMLLAEICSLYFRKNGIKLRDPDHYNPGCINSYATSRADIVRDLQDFIFCNECKQHMESTFGKALIRKSEWIIRPHWFYDQPREIILTIGAFSFGVALTLLGVIFQYNEIHQKASLLINAFGIIFMTVPPTILALYIFHREGQRNKIYD